MTTRLYEGMFLTDSAVASKDWSGLEAHIKEIISKHGGELLYSEKWPDRRLAYEIKGCKKGTYYLTYFNSEGDAIEEMRREVALSERILRVLFIQEEGLEKEMEGRKNKEIEIPPAELAFGRDRAFDSTGRPGGGRGGPRGDRPPREAAPPEGEAAGVAAGSQEGESAPPAEGS